MSYPNLPDGNLKPDKDFFVDIKMPVVRSYTVTLFNGSEYEDIEYEEYDLISYEKFIEASGLCQEIGWEGMVHGEEIVI